jgi:hypothetical protein
MGAVDIARGWRSSVQTLEAGTFADVCAGNGIVGCEAATPSFPCRGHPVEGSTHASRYSQGLRP